jgi:hypothetical protein
MSKSPLRELRTAGEVIDAIGAGRVAELTDREHNHVSNWRREGRLASHSFLILTAELALLGCRASPTLWGIAVPRQTRTAKKLRVAS